MLIVSSRKYEEISPTHVEDFCYITDNTYTKQEVVKMEFDVLKFLKYEVGNPTIKTFLRYFNATLLLCLYAHETKICIHVANLIVPFLVGCRRFARVAKEDYNVCMQIFFKTFLLFLPWGFLNIDAHLSFF